MTVIKKSLIWITLSALLLSLTACGLSESALPEGEIYHAQELLYTGGVYSYVQTADAAPEIKVVDNHLWMRDSSDDEFEDSGELKTVTLTKENFEDYFNFSLAWEDDVPTLEEIRESANAAYTPAGGTQSDTFGVLYLLVGDEDIYLCCGHDGKIRWLYRYTQGERIKLIETDSYIMFDYEGNWGYPELSFHDGQFSIYYGPLSSYFGHGTYETDGDIITLNHFEEDVTTVLDASNMDLLKVISSGFRDFKVGDRLQKGMSGSLFDRYPRLKVTADGTTTLREAEIPEEYDYKLYYYGLSRVTVVDMESGRTLEEMLESGRVTLEEIIGRANTDAGRDICIRLDHGLGEPETPAYAYEYRYLNYVIIKMNALNSDGSVNHDIYIGPPAMHLDSLGLLKE